MVRGLSRVNFIDTVVGWINVWVVLRHRYMQSIVTARCPEKDTSQFKIKENCGSFKSCFFTILIIMCVVHNINVGKFEIRSSVLFFCSKWKCQHLKDVLYTIILKKMEQTVSRECEPVTPRRRICAQFCNYVSDMWLGTCREHCNVISITIISKNISMKGEFITETSLSTTFRPQLELK